MVAKISLGDSLYGALRYNGEKINKEQGRVLDTNKIYNDGSGNVDIRRAFEDFQRWMPQSTRAEKTMMHISLNPHPDDRLSEGEYAQLAHEYMEKMGFGDMPYIIVKHQDIDRHHIHIVALRVRPDGTCISDRNNFYKSKDICRELEKKYGLRPAERQKITPDMPIRKVDPGGDIKRQVANTVKMVGMRWKFQSMGEYNAILSLYNVKCEQTDGRVNGREYHGWCISPPMAAETQSPLLSRLPGSASSPAARPLTTGLRGQRIRLMYARQKGWSLTQWLQPPARTISLPG